MSESLQDSATAEACFSRASRKAVAPCAQCSALKWMVGLRGRLAGHWVISFTSCTESKYNSPSASAWSSPSWWAAAVMHWRNSSSSICISPRWQQRGGKASLALKQTLVKSLLPPFLLLCLTRLTHGQSVWDVSLADKTLFGNMSKKMDQQPSSKITINFHIQSGLCLPESASSPRRFIVRHPRCRERAGSLCVTGDQFKQADNVEFLPDHLSSFLCKFFQSPKPFPVSTHAYPEFAPAFHSGRLQRWRGSRLRAPFSLRPPSVQTVGTRPPAVWKTGSTGGRSSGLKGMAQSRGCRESWSD